MRSLFSSQKYIRTLLFYLTLVSLRYHTVSQRGYFFYGFCVGFRLFLLWCWFTDFWNGCYEDMLYICNFCVLCFYSQLPTGLDLIQNSTRKIAYAELTKTAVSATNYCFIVSLSYSYFLFVYNVRALMCLCASIIRIVRFCKHLS